MARRSVEVRARTKEEAVGQALEQLGATRDEVQIEVLEEGRAGVFGVGSQDAWVRITLLDDYEEEEEEEGEGEEREDEQPSFPEQDAQIARDMLEQMLDLLDFPNVVTVTGVERQEGVTTIRLDVAAEEVGLLIGRHGETLASLQFLLNACLGQRLGRSARALVDVEHYRDRREQTLRGIALRAADLARRERRPVTLAPMPANERRIVHMTLQSSPYVATESTGDGPERRVVIVPQTGTPQRRPTYGPQRT
jgi:spoIIIJ-associated protein